MQVFRSILSKEQVESDTPDQEITITKMTEYISVRFLGVLTYFETTLIDPENERSVKSGALMSLGEIIRFLGTNKITPFRFKILSMLKTAQLLDDPELTRISIQIWTIFIHTVDIETLGSLLSTIIVSLEPLLKIQSEEINSICKYLIITNGNLLSRHISDLFFIEETNVSDEIKAIVKRQTKYIQQEKFIVKLFQFIKYINHENLGVRLYGIKYLRSLLKQNRDELNHLIVGQNTIVPILETLLDNLMVGCKHTDENLQLASGECLGELGAIEPSLISINYSPEKHKFALSIHSDVFAAMALDELCRAYQFQKDTKYVDSFSLAIQEILTDRDVNPKINKNIHVWEAIPERMRSLMEPLLTSCYTGFRKNPNITIHPIYGSSKCRTFEDWSFIWATKMIDHVESVKTKLLLNSFKPSIKRNMNILSMFLPYIILHSLASDNKENQKHIAEEVNAVLTAITTTNRKTGNPIEISKQTQRSWRSINMIVLDSYKNNTNFDSQVVRNTVDFDIGIKSAKLIFNQFDFLTQWLRNYRKKYAINKEYKSVENFLNSFDRKLLAKANYNCNDYARALMYIESYIEENPLQRLQDELTFLAEIYGELMNPDSLEGAMSLKVKEPTLSEQILAHNVTGRLQESAACFERMMQVSEVEGVSIDHMKNIIHCYLRLDQPETALLMSQGLLEKIYDKKNYYLLQEQRAEPLWRLSRFEELEELVKIPQIRESSNWGVKCGQLLLNIRKQNFVEFNETLKTTRLTILLMLKASANEQNAYHKGYPHVLKLHFINEFENIGELIKDTNRLFSVDGKTMLTELFENWNSRLELLQSTAKLMEPILCLRRTLLVELKNLMTKHCYNRPIMNDLVRSVDNYIGHLYIKSTELAIKAGNIQQGQIYIMNAEPYENQEMFLVKSKLLWKKGEQRNTFKLLEKETKALLARKKVKDVTELSVADRKIYSRAKLLIAKYNAESMNIDTNLNLVYFRDAVKSFPESEKCLVYLAQYTDKVFASLTDDEQQGEMGTSLLHEVLLNYGKSMLYGCHYIYQSMPRLLSIWLDFTAKMKSDEKYRVISSKMNKMVEKLSNLLPPFIFFTCFSQLVSRICHPSPEVYSVIKTILVKLILNFPQQSLWMISSVFKSSYSNRVKRCIEIFEDKRLNNSETQKLIDDFNSLVEKLIELTNKDIQQTPVTITKLVPSLPQLFSSTKFSQIILPIQKQMQPNLPPQSTRDKPADTFKAFPNNFVFIRGIKDEVVILQSLQRPRKIALLGTDGLEYIVMLKPKDDLRKDYRLMEFNSIVKEYLHQDPDARERRLNIRTYAVIPLNEECGIIEWVQNLETFRAIVTDIYKQRGILMMNREIKNASCDIKDAQSKKRDVFLRIFLPRHPPVFSDWFKVTFTTPHNWYQARTAYIKTTAVMSMVGYILGLGDRHGENILFDSTNGDTVHVDFNCLFNKGETFDYPERVPFRLTHNMVHAMGPLGVEGLFRKCCEITLKILRTQTPTLMSVLKPFVYDPLVSWSRTTKSHNHNLERTDPQAMTNVKHIEERLKGFVS